MAATMTSLSTVILAAKGILQILHYSSEIFKSALARMFYEKMVANPKQKLGTLQKTNFQNLSIQ